MGEPRFFASPGRCLKHDLILVERLPEHPGSYFCFECSQKLVETPAQRMEMVALRIEDARERLDSVIASQDCTREMYRTLVDIDKILRETKRSLGFINAGLDRYGKAADAKREIARVLNGKL